MSTQDTLDSILDELLRSYAREPLSHAECKAVAAERERLRSQFITKLLRAAGVVVKG